MGDPTAPPPTPQDRHACTARLRSRARRGGPRRARRLRGPRRNRGAGGSGRRVGSHRPHRPAVDARTFRERLPGCALLPGHHGPPERHRPPERRHHRPYRGPHRPYRGRHPRHPLDRPGRAEGDSVPRHDGRRARHPDPERRGGRHPVRRAGRRRPGRGRKLPGRGTPPLGRRPAARPALGSRRRCRAGHRARHRVRLRDHGHQNHLVPFPAVAGRATRRRPGPPGRAGGPADDHDLDLRHPRGQRRGNRWRDANGNPEHRIDKIGVLRAARPVG